MQQVYRVTSFVSTNIKHLIITRGIQSSSCPQAKVAVVLSGCGVFDGSEIHESSAVLVHLSRAGADVKMFAPDMQQMHTINHLKGEPCDTNRNVLEESARIARGKIQPLSELDTKAFDAVLFPGGFGAAKNLSTFAVDGPSMKVNAQVDKVLKSFHAAKKPIGLCCISPVLAAKVIKGCEVTIGSDAATASAIEDVGAKHVKKNVSEVHTDVKNMIVTTPAFMCEASLHEIFDGIGTMINKVLAMTK